MIPSYAAPPRASKVSEPRETCCCCVNEYIFITHYIPSTTRSRSVRIRQFSILHSRKRSIQLFFDNARSTIVYHHISAGEWKANFIRESVTEISFVRRISIYIYTYIYININIYIYIYILIITCSLRVQIRARRWLKRAEKCEKKNVTIVRAQVVRFAFN